MFIASAVDFFQAEQQICSQLGEHNPSAARAQYVSQGIFLWRNTLPTSMKLLTINSSGCGDQSNIAFYWSPGGYIQTARIPLKSPALAPQGELLQLEGSLGGKHCPWGLWCNVWGSPGQRQRPATTVWSSLGLIQLDNQGRNIFFSQQVIVIKSTSLNFIFFFFRNVLLFPYVCEPGWSIRIFFI